MGPQMYGVKWHNFKLVLVAQRYMQDPAARLPTPRPINLATDPQEREPVSLPYLHSWVATHFNRIIGEFEASIHREPPIPVFDQRGLRRQCQPELVATQGDAAESRRLECRRSSDPRSRWTSHRGPVRYRVPAPELAQHA
jgi:hypothetical protein